MRRVHAFSSPGSPYNLTLFTFLRLNNVTVCRHFLVLREDREHEESHALVRTLHYNITCYYIDKYKKRKRNAFLQPVDRLLAYCLVATLTSLIHCTLFRFRNSSLRRVRQVKSEQNVKYKVQSVNLRQVLKLPARAVGRAAGGCELKVQDFCETCHPLLPFMSGRKQ